MIPRGGRAQGDLGTVRRAARPIRRHLSQLPLDRRDPQLALRQGVCKDERRRLYRQHRPRTSPTSQSSQRRLAYEKGAVIDEPALIRALDSGKVARAGLDVFVGEPVFKSPFYGRDDVTVQPHTGAYTKGTFATGERVVFGNVKAL